MYMDVLTCKESAALATAITSNTFPTLGNPFIVYEESDKSSAPRPVLMEHMLKQ
jgi:hypothetical protein